MCGCNFGRAASSFLGFIRRRRRRLLIQNRGGLLQAQTRDNDFEPLVAFRMPRSPVLSFMLHFSTLGFYALFWVITVLRDLARIGLVLFSAWFWLYAPFTYAQHIVAFPGLFKVLEERAGLRHYRALWFVWVIVSLGIVIFLFLFSRGVQPMWHYLLALTLWSLVVQ